ncbi:MAG: hypothetical protein JSS87_13435 [Acidobacteria bacterium]|nr:hypothetical protein [Acidobacteriota bacterium]
MKIDNLMQNQQLTHGYGDSIRDRKMHDAAEKFEAVLLGEMLKPLANKGENDEEKGGVMASYGLEALAGAMAKQGGLGFAHRMEERFEKTAAKSFPAADSKIKK